MPPPNIVQTVPTYQSVAPPPITRGMYHLNRNGVSSGSHTPEAILQMLRSREVLSTDLVWTEGMERWMPVAGVPELWNSYAVNSGLGSGPHGKPLKWMPLCIATAIGTAQAIRLAWPEVIGTSSETFNGDEFRLFASLLVTVLVVLILWSQLHFKLWKSLPSDLRATSPGKAVGLMLVPLFNLYWAFVTWPKLGQGMIQWQKRRNVRSPMNFTALGYMVAALYTSSFLFWQYPLLSLLLTVASVLVEVAFYYQVTTAANRLLGFQDE